MDAPLQEPMRYKDAPRPWRKWEFWSGPLLMCGLLLGSCVIVVPAVHQARHAARSSHCSGHLFKLVFALNNYHDHFGCFPPAYLADADGNPLHSWRVLILPFLADWDVLDDYRFDEPWDSPHNLKLDTTRSYNYFSCPNAPDHENTSMTNYVVVTGARTAFPGAESTSIADIHDGLATTLLVVEIADSDIHWMEPRDLDYDRMSRVNDSTKPRISSHDGHAHVAFGDGRIRRMPESISPATVRALLTIAGGEPIDGEAPFRDVISVPPEGEADRGDGRGL
jgi:hypothetical protein